MKECCASSQLPLQIKKKVNYVIIDGRSVVSNTVSNTISDCSFYPTVEIFFHGENLMKH